MGKRKSAKAGGAAESILRAAKHHEDQDAGSDGEDRDKSEDYMSFISKANQKNENDDSLSDASSVFDLAAGGHSDDTSTSGDDDSSSENDSSEEDGGDDSDSDASNSISANLSRLADSLPASLRQKVRSGQRIRDGTASSDESDEDDVINSKIARMSNKEAAAVLAGSWGRKQAYWMGDTADLEIGQDMQDAEDEEEAARDLEKSRLQAMNAEDFGDYSSSEDSDSDSEEDEAADHTGTLGSVSLGNTKAKSSTVDRNIHSLSSPERKRLLVLDAPELAAVASDVRKKEVITQLLEVLGPLRSFLEDAQTRKHYGASSTDEAMNRREMAFLEYLHLKEQYLSSYLLNLLFLVNLHVQKLTLQDHPVMKQILELQYLSRTIKKLDDEFEMDLQLLLELCKDLSMEGGSKKAPLSDMFSKVKSKIASLNGYKESADARETLDGDVEDTGGDSDGGDGDGDGGSHMSQPSSDGDYEEYIREEEEAMNSVSINSRRKKRNVSRSDSDSDSDTSRGDMIDSGELHDSYESEAKLRSQLNRRKLQKRALSMSLDAFGSVASKDREKKSAGSDDALAKQKGGSTKRPHPEDYSDDSDAASHNDGDNSNAGDVDMDNDQLEAMRSILELAESGAKKRRRPAPEDDTDDLYESFTNKKKEYLKKKKEHYQPEARYGGMFEVDSKDIVKNGSAKRAATYEMIKNKGLTPHRKKANRNPRVKKRLAYDKALVRRRGQVREVNSSGVNTASDYGGEATGIKANLSRARKIST